MSDKPIFQTVSEITAASQGQSGAVQLYALHHDFSIWQGVIISDCRVSLTTQNVYPVSNPHADWSSLVDLGELGVTTDVWTMSGSALKVNIGDSVERFLGYEEREIREQLERYLVKYPELNTRDLIILDMEHPVHPAGLGRPDNAAHFDAIIEAFKTRIRIARENLPHAKLALYGVIVPEGQAKVDLPVFRDRMDGYRRAAASSLFDEVDYLTPVLYTRWGPDDACGRKYLLRYCSFAAYNRMGIIETTKLTGKPIVPILNLRVFNRGSRNDHQLLSAEMARAQLTYLQSRPEVTRVVYWAPPRPSNVKGNYSPPEEILLFFCRLNSCGRWR